MRMICPKSKGCSRQACPVGRPHNLDGMCNATTRNCPACVPFEEKVMFGIDENAVLGAIIGQVRKVHPTLPALLAETSDDPKVERIRKLFAEMADVSVNFKRSLAKIIEEVVGKPIPVSNDGKFKAPPFAVLRPVDAGCDPEGILFIGGDEGLRFDGKVGDFNCTKRIWTTVELEKAEGLVKKIPFGRLIDTFGEFLRTYVPDGEKKDEVEIVRP